MSLDEKSDRFVEIVENDFNTWFNGEVKEYINEPLTAQHIEVLCRTAWMNGVYVAVNTM